jgi:hypothetical protein
MIAVLAIVLAIFALATKEYRLRQAIRRHLLSLGADHVGVNADRSIRLFFTHPVDTTEFQKFGKIEAVELKQFHVEAATLRSLAPIESIDMLMFQLCTLDGVDAAEELTQFQSIRNLVFWNTTVGDPWVDSITKVAGLERVDLSNTKISPEGLARLRAALPNVLIDCRP